MERRHFVLWIVVHFIYMTVGFTSSLINERDVTTSPCPPEKEFRAQMCSCHILSSRAVTIQCVNNATAPKLETVSESFRMPFPSSATYLSIFNFNFKVLFQDDFKNLTNLITLQLDQNRIETISLGTFNALKKLQRLTLNRNILTRIVPGMFGSLPPLKFLELKENEISSINWIAFSEIGNQYSLNVNLGQTRFDCDCVILSRIYARNVTIIAGKCTNGLGLELFLQKNCPNVLPILTTTTSTSVPTKLIGNGSGLVWDTRYNMHVSEMYSYIAAIREGMTGDKMLRFIAWLTGSNTSFNSSHAYLRLKRDARKYTPIPFPFKTTPHKRTKPYRSVVPVNSASTKIIKATSSLKLSSSPLDFTRITINTALSEPVIRTKSINGLKSIDIISTRHLPRSSKALLNGKLTRVIKPTRVHPRHKWSKSLFSISSSLSTSLNAAVVETTKPRNQFSTRITGHILSSYYDTQSAIDEKLHGSRKSGHSVVRTNAPKLVDSLKTERIKTDVPSSNYRRSSILHTSYNPVPSHTPSSSLIYSTDPAIFTSLSKPRMLSTLSASMLSYEMLQSYNIENSKSIKTPILASTVETLLIDHPPSEITSVPILASLHKLTSVDSKFSTSFIVRSSTSSDYTISPTGPKVLSTYNEKFAETSNLPTILETFHEGSTIAHISTLYYGPSIKTVDIRAVESNNESSASSQMLSYSIKSSEAVDLSMSSYKYAATGYKVVSSSDNKSSKIVDTLTLASTYVPVETGHILFSDIKPTETTNNNLLASTYNLKERGPKLSSYDVESTKMVHASLLASPYKSVVTYNKMPSSDDMQPFKSTNAAASWSWYRPISIAYKIWPSSSVDSMKINSRSLLSSLYHSSPRGHELYSLYGASSVKSHSMSPKDSSYISVSSNMVTLLPFQSPMSISSSMLNIAKSFDHVSATSFNMVSMKLDITSFFHYSLHTVVSPYLTVTKVNELSSHLISPPTRDISQSFHSNKVFQTRSSRMSSNNDGMKFTQSDFFIRDTASDVAILSSTHTLLQPYTTLSSRVAIESHVKSKISHEKVQSSTYISVSNKIVKSVSDTKLSLDKDFTYTTHESFKLHTTKAYPQHSDIHKSIFDSESSLHSATSLVRTSDINTTIKSHKPLTPSSDSSHFNPRTSEHATESHLRTEKLKTEYLPSSVKNISIINSVLTSSSGFHMLKSHTISVKFKTITPSIQRESTSINSLTSTIVPKQEILTSILNQPSSFHFTSTPSVIITEPSPSSSMFYTYFVTPVVLIASTQNLTVTEAKSYDMDSLALHSFTSSFTAITSYFSTLSSIIPSLKSFYIINSSLTSILAGKTDVWSIVTDTTTNFTEPAISSTASAIVSSTIETTKTVLINATTIVTTTSSDTKTNTIVATSNSADATNKTAATLNTASLARAATTTNSGILYSLSPSSAYLTPATREPPPPTHSSVVWSTDSASQLLLTSTTLTTSDPSERRRCHQCDADICAVTECDSIQVACETRVLYADSKVIIHRGCAILSMCKPGSLAHKLDKDNCKKYDHGIVCQLCCTNNYCNNATHHAIPFSIKHEYELLLTVNPDYLKEEYKSSSSDKYSKSILNFTLNSIRNELWRSFEPWQRPVLVTGKVSMIQHVFSELNIRITLAINVMKGSVADIDKVALWHLVNVTIRQMPLKNTTVYIGNIVLDAKDLCEESTSHSDAGEILWPTSGVGSVQQPCPNNHSINATRQCILTDIAEWQAVEDERCIILPKQVTKDLIRIKERIKAGIKTKEQLARLTQDVAAASTESQTFTKTEVAVTIDIISMIIEKAIHNMSSEDISNTLTTINNILAAPRYSLRAADAERGSVKRLLKAINQLSLNMPLNDGSVIRSQSSLTIAAKQVYKSSFNGVTLFNSADMNEFQFKDGARNRDMTDGVYIPDSITVKMTSAESRVHFVIYSDDTLFDIINKEDTNGSIVSKVISATVGTNSISELSEPIRITLSHPRDNRSRQCVYWNETGNTWSDFGCTITAQDDTFTICSCDHLSNFALLMRVHKTVIPVEHQRVLTVISLVGCSVSVGGLILTILTFLLFRKLRRGKPTKILLNLCFALTALNVFFIMSIQEFVLRHSIACKVVAVLLHYMLLSSLTWMAIEAFYMYIALVRVFNTHIDKFLLKCALVGWGLPLIIIAVTLGHNKTNNYGLQPTDICWVDQLAFYGAVLAPVALIILLNFTAFVLVIRQITGMTKKKLNKSETTDMATQLRGAIGVCILLGLTWIFAIFAVGEASLAFQYLFCIFNCLQGLFIFLFYCMLKKDVQNAWIRVCCPGAEFTSSSFQSSSKVGQSKYVASTRKLAQRQSNSGSAVTRTTNDGSNSYERSLSQNVDDDSYMSQSGNGHRNDCAVCRMKLSNVKFCTRL